jgi:hypothetical protein
MGEKRGPKLQKYKNKKIFWGKKTKTKTKKTKKNQDENKKTKNPIQSTRPGTSDGLGDDLGHPRHCEEII